VRTDSELIQRGLDDAAMAIVEVRNSLWIYYWTLVVLTTITLTAVIIVTLL